jgi:isoamylase
MPMTSPPTLSRPVDRPPLGARLDAAGATFALFSSVAQAVDLCLFDADGSEHRFAMFAGDGYRWQGWLDGVRAGTRYGYRVHGPWDPGAGQRCNPSKLLLDPYARAVSGTVTWNDAILGHVPGDPDTPSDTDSAAFAPRGVLVDERFDWGSDQRPDTPLAETIIYETHVRGFTELAGDVPAPLRGTYAGLAQPAAIRRLTSLGITAVELLPVHQFVSDGTLINQGLSNYWGYQSIGFFAPHHAYSSAGDLGQQVTEFKSLVAALHAAGLEVILDVVFNHTPEGNQWGPTLSMRGIDNAAYYRLTPDNRGYVDDTGTGNTFDAHREPGLALVMDSLRYWVSEMHVDGFRFDLAAALARDASDFDGAGIFLEAIGQDPVLSAVKLIAEPWDTGWGGYDVGAFPAGWSEWNGKFRDTVRDFWRSTDDTLADFATRVSGSADLYGHAGRTPAASVNFVTCHDGFTLADLVSYDSKHNEANGEHNADGTGDNRSWNCGAEGPTDDAGIRALRRQQRRNFLATTLLSAGVPMIGGGDEIGRTQGGNNNAYCQDNAASWYDWTLAGTADDLTGFVAALCALRRRHAALRPRAYGGAAAGAGSAESWFRPDGSPMTGADWQNPWSRAVTLLISPTPGADDDQFLLIVNSWWQPLPVTLPELGGTAPGGTAPGDTAWTVVLDTAADSPDGAPAAGVAGPGPGRAVTLAGRSLQLLQART